MKKSTHSTSPFDILRSFAKELSGGMRPDPENKNQRTWSAGTLVYTLPGLLVLFICLLGGEFAWAMKDRAIGSAATLRFKSFTDDVDLYSILLISFPSFTNIFLMPIVSYLSDRHRGRWGRRIPYLAFTTPFIVLGAWGLGFAPYLATKLVALVGDRLSYTTACIACFALFWAMLDFGSTLAGALSGALINDVVPKNLIGRFFGFNRALSLLAGILFNKFLMGKIEAHFLAIFLGIGAVYGAGLALLCLTVKEGTYPEPPPKPVDQSTLTTVFRPFLEYFRQCFSKPFYRLAIAVLVVCSLCATPFNLYTILYAKSPDINLDMGIFGEILATCYIVSFLLSFILGVFADRLHPIRASIIMLIAYLSSMIFGWFYVHDTPSFKTILYLHTILSGSYFTVSASLAQRIYPRALFAQFNSASAMISSLTVTLLGLFCGKFFKLLNNDFRYIFLLSTFLTALGIIGLLSIWRAMRPYGGLFHYQAPNPDTP